MELLKRSGFPGLEYFQTRTPSLVAYYSLARRTDLKEIFPDVKNGSKLVLTSSQTMETTEVSLFLHRMMPLSEDNSWEMFKENVGPVTKPSPETCASFPFTSSPYSLVALSKVVSFSFKLKGASDTAADMPRTQWNCFNSKSKPRCNRDRSRAQDANTSSERKMYLRKLSLHDNAIGGLIPKELGFLPNLRGIQLYNNKFTGLIPPTLGSCTLLQNLNFSNNSLVGQIPDSFGNCTMLFNVNLSMNALSNYVPLSLINSNSLMFLSLQYNNFTGLVPDSWGGEGNGGKSKVKSLTFDHNFFSGRIPVSLSKLTDLKVISFGHNKLNGEIPSEIGKLEKLKSLDLSYNAINGSIPIDFSKLTSLTSLNLAHNSLTGQIPSFLGDDLKLASLNLFSQMSQIKPLQEPKHQGNLAFCRIILCCLLKKRDKRVKEADTKGGGVGPTKEDPAEAGPVGAGDCEGKLVHFEGGMEFTADDLLCATSEILGKSTYGTVYKASLAEGKQVAVKRFRERIAESKGVSK
ncbi:probable leucine-rich repeat receptor-like protein kinase IMK3 [Tanacetum coccineum]